MQTFLPYADFAESAYALDPARLGKQRVEALQILRASVLPVYGWKNHPAVVMWRGYIPALTRYSLDMVDAWTTLGHADTTRDAIAEFAPEARETPAENLSLPSWLGNEQLHLSHQSNLVRKWPEFYGSRFPSVPGDLPYLWPGADDVPPAPVADAPRLWVFRPSNTNEEAEWLETASVSLAEVSPLGRRSRNWLAQLDAFAELPAGTAVGVLADAGSTVVHGRLLGEVTAYRSENGESGIRRAVVFEGEYARGEFAYPALLQDPRSIFETAGPLAAV